MNKLELIAKVLISDLQGAENKEEMALATLKGFAADMLNLSQMLQDRSLDAEAAREIMEQQGMEYSRKTKKYS